jgi:hypothetical protein
MSHARFALVFSELLQFAHTNLLDLALPHLTGTACAAHAFEPPLLLAFHSLRCCLEGALHWPTFPAATQRSIYWKVRNPNYCLWYVAIVTCHNKAPITFELCLRCRHLVGCVAAVTSW